MKDTKQRIVDRALEMFNESGIEYVGMRELAADLDMRVGNITYYFPTKDDLVNELGGLLARANGELFAPSNEMSLLDFLETRRQVFNNQYQYRCLQVSFVHLMNRDEAMKENYGKIWKERIKAMATSVEYLRANKYISIEREDAEMLTATLATVGRLWVTESMVVRRSEGAEQQVSYYLSMFAHLFKPYATKKGLADIKKFEKGNKH